MLALIDEGTGHLLCVGQPDVELNGRGAEEPVAVTYRDVQGDWLGRRTRGCFECDVTVASVQGNGVGCGRGQCESEVTLHIQLVVLSGREQVWRQEHRDLFGTKPQCLSSLHFLLVLRHARYRIKYFVKPQQNIYVPINLWIFSN